ncbi:MAG: lysophospholipid acyltransferase family protein, partial [Armatimonadetes bacterium]|nr:lysophospholipid acyltransferase family protein [Armatimonadota bacterium]
LIPLSWCRAAGRLGGYALYAISPRRQRLADANLVAAFGDRFSSRERRAIRLRVAQNMTTLFAELFKMRTLTREEIMALVPADGIDRLHAALARGKGAILISAHFGNWEAAGARLAAEGVDVAVVARDASDADVASMINSSRAGVQLRVIQKDSALGMVRHLRANGVLAILPDQHSNEDPVRVNFLGRPAWCARGPAMLALRTGCAVVPGFALREPNGSLRGYILEEIPRPGTEDGEAAVQGLMQRIYDVIGGQITAHPEQWLWFHNRWKEYSPPQSEAEVVDAAEDGA